MPAEARAVAPAAATLRIGTHLPAAAIVTAIPATADAFLHAPAALFRAILPTADTFLYTSAAPITAVLTAAEQQQIKQTHDVSSPFVDNESFPSSIIIWKVP